MEKETRSMKRVFILGACRTPIGKMGGALASLSAVELGSIAVTACISLPGIDVFFTL